MPTSKRSLVELFLVFLGLGLALAPVMGQEKGWPQALGSPTPLSEIVNPDGTLRLGPGVQGSFDPQGFRMVSGPAGEPRFIPEGPGLQPKTVEAAAAAGDEYWTPQFDQSWTIVNGPLYAVAISGTDVYVGGAFSQAGGNTSCSNIAKWNGTTWSALQSGTNGSVRAIAVSGTDVFVGGLFTSPHPYFARFRTDVGLWISIGVNGSVWAIAVSGTDVYVGGVFTNAGGIAAADYVAKWNVDTGAWSALGGGLNQQVMAIAVIGADVYAGGFFTNAGGIAAADYVARWNGTAWSALGSGVNGHVLAMAASGTDLYVGGEFTMAGNSPIDYIAKWSGTSWTALGSGLDGPPSALAAMGRDLYAGGFFGLAGGVAVSCIAKWNGASWSALGSGVDNQVLAIAASGGDVYVGGNFLHAGGQWSYYFARWVEPLSVESPNGGEVWDAGSSHAVTWSADASVGPVKIEYSTNNGSTWTTVAASTANTGSYAWVVPNAPSASCRVRVSEAEDADTSDASDAVFTIAGFQVTLPGSIDKWTVGTPRTITWNTAGSFPTVRIELSTDNGATWSTITSSAPNTGSYIWTVAGAVSSQAVIRVSDSADGLPFDDSAAFSIIPVLVITVTSPNGGETWEAGSSHAITWTAYGGVGNVRIEYTTNNGSTWTTIATSTANDGSQSWTVPATPSVSCRVRITEVYDGEPVDASDAPFTIAGLRVTSPNGNEYWEVGSAYAITWESVGSYPALRIELSTDNGGTWETIAASTANTGSYPWTTPELVSYSCRIRISDAVDGVPSDMSDVTFVIYEPTRIRVTSPNGGETWLAGSTHEITWESSEDIWEVDIAYSTDNGANYTFIGVWEENDGSFSWTLPDTISVSCLVQVYDSNYLAFDTSDSVFSIVASIREDDFVGTWDGQGVYYRNSGTAAWVKLATPATKITVGDLDGDEIDDLIGLWPGQGGIWAKYSDSGTWAKLSSTAQYIAAGDMNGDGRVDLVGTWDGQGVFYRDSITGAWVKMATPATMVTVGDIDKDGTDDLIGLWPSQGGIWVKYSETGAWARLSSTAVHIASGDMNGDGRDDLLGTWDGQGVYYRDSVTGSWVKMASPATLITTGDIDGDAIDDLLGIWPTQGGVWVKYSSDGAWERLSSTAQDIAAGKMRAASGGGEAQPEGGLAIRQDLVELPFPMGGNEEGPGLSLNKRDLSDQGPGGARFVYLEDINLEPKKEESARLTRVLGPGEPGATWAEQKNLYPQEGSKIKTENKADRKKLS